MFDEILFDIAEKGYSWRKALKDENGNLRMSSRTFDKLLNIDEEKVKRYARACEMRADVIADEIMEIADNVGGDMITLKDGREVVDNAVVQRDRLRVDSRKWLLAKLQPKKYGERIDVDHSTTGVIDIEYIVPK
jgi:hypothetical protein